MSFSKDAFLIMAEQCRKAGALFVLVGGFAVNFHRVTRNTDDVDFLMTEEGFEKARPFLSEAGYSQMMKQHLYARLRKEGEWEGQFPDIDVLFTNPSTLDVLVNQACDMDLGREKIPGG